MLIIGSHVSFKKGTELLESVKEALSYGANTFMIYTGAPQNTRRSPISLDKTKEAVKLMEDNGIDIKNVIVHAPYIVNLANDQNKDFNIEFLKEEINRTKQLGIKKLVLHPGSHVGLGVDVGIKNIIDSLNCIIDDSVDVDICLETMAGKGSEIGSSFEEIRQIIDGVKMSNKIKVCLDTCHINDAGYDIGNFDKVLVDFDKVIGLEKLACVHINDSKNIIGSHKDRHENFGYGNLGFENLINIIYHDKLKDVPKILETPYVKDESGSYPPYKFEIEMIKDKKFNPNLINDIIKYYK